MITGLTDIHYHGIPGVDDGAKSSKEAFKMLEISYNEGIRNIIFTPHFHNNKYRIHGMELDKHYFNFIKEIEEVKGLKILPWLGELNFYLGNEIYYSSSCVNKLNDGIIKPIAGSNYILVEFSPREDYKYIRDACYNLLSNGYFPILAHVERYNCLLNSINKTIELWEMGVYLQVNADAISGLSRFKERWFIHKLLKGYYVTFIATDAHGAQTRPPYIQKSAAYMKRKYNERYIDEILFANPKKLINNELILQRSFVYE